MSSPWPIFTHVIRCYRGGSPAVVNDTLGVTVPKREIVNIALHDHGSEGPMVYQCGYVHGNLACHTHLNPNSSEVKIENVVSRWHCTAHCKLASACRSQNEQAGNGCARLAMLHYFMAPNRLGIAAWITYDLEL